MLKFALKNLKTRVSRAILAAIAVILCTSIALVTYNTANQMEDGVIATAGYYDTIVGPEGSQLQLALSTLFYVENPLGTICYGYYEELKEHPSVTEIYPFAAGDTYRSAPIIGTIPEYLDRFTLASGKIFHEPEEAVLGYNIARAGILDIGDIFVGTHGHADHGHVHDDFEYIVVGTLARTGTASDNVIFTTMESVWMIHDDHDHDHEDEHEHEHEDDHDHNDHNHHHDEHHDDHSDEHHDHDHHHEDEGHEHNDEHGGEDGHHGHDAHHHNDNHYDEGHHNGHEHSEDEHGHDDHDAEHSHSEHNDHHHDDEHHENEVHHEEHSDDHHHNDEHHHEDEGHEHDDEHGHHGHDDHDHDHNDSCLGARDEIVSIILKTDSLAAHNEIVAKFEDTPGVQAINPATVLRGLLDNLSMGRDILYILAAVIMFMTAVIIYVTTASFIEDSKKDILIMRLVGIKRKTIFSMFIVQSAFIAIVSMGISFLLSIGILSLINQFTTANLGILIDAMKRYPGEGLLLLSVFIIVIISAVISITPAYKRDPLEVK